MDRAFVIDFLGGFFGGVASTYIGHPLDTVKVRLQTQTKGSVQYRGAWHCFRTILKQEKFRGLYKGVTSPLTGIALMNATIFSVYGKTLKSFSEEKTINHWWAGCAAGIAQSVIISPVELIKTQMQIQGIGKSDMKNYRGWRATCGHIINHSGYSGMNNLASIRRSSRAAFSGFGFGKGLSVCIVRDIPSFGAFFYSYELLIGRPNLLNYGGNYGLGSVDQVSDFAKIIFAGGVAGVNSWVISYPADVVKTRIQAQHLDRPAVYKDPFPSCRCFVQGLRSEGWRFCWHGVGPTCLRAFPSNAAVFIVWQLFNDTFNS